MIKSKNCNEKIENWLKIKKKKTILFSNTSSQKYFVINLKKPYQTPTIHSRNTNPYADKYIAKYIKGFNTDFCH